MLKINGVVIDTPKGYEVMISDLDGESNRNARGKLLRDRIAVKRKLVCEWPPLTQNQISRLLNAVSSVYFTCQFIDPQVGVMTRTMYVGDRTSPAYCFIDGEMKWSGLKMNFIEQ